MDVLREIFVLLGMKTDEKSFEKSMLAVEAIHKGAEALVEAFKSAGEAVIDAFVETGKAAEQFLNLSQRTGIAASTLQEFAGIAKVAGIDSDAFTIGMRSLSLQMEKAAEGSAEAQGLFAKLGVKATGTDGKLRPLEDVMGDISDRFNEMPNGAKKLALATEALGRSGGQLIPILNKGSDALAQERAEIRASGAVMSDEMTKNAKALDDSFDSVGHTLEGLKNAIIEPLLVPLKDVIDEFSRWFAANRLIIASGITRVVKAIGQALYFVWRIAVPVVELFARFASTTVGTVVIIGTLVLALAALAAGFLGAAAAAAPLVLEMLIAGAPIVAIGAAILGLIAILGLLAEDIYGYFHGKQSVFGLFVDALSKLGGEISRIASDWFTTAIEHWKTQFLDFRDWAKAQLGIGGKEGTGFVGMAAPGSTFDDTGRLLTGGIAGAALAGSPGAGGGQSINPSFRASVVVNGAPGMDGASVGNAVRESLDDWWATKVEQAFTNTVGQYSPAPGGG